MTSSLTKNTRAVVGMAATLLLVPVGAAAETPSGFQVTDLNGASMAVPAGLPEARTLLLLGFHHRDHDLLQAWRRGLGLRIADRGWFEIPVIGVGSPVIRSMILHGMERGTSGSAEKAHLAPAFTDAVAVARQFGVDPDQPAAIVVDRTGRVLAHATGQFDPVKARVLTDAWAPASP